MVPHSRSHGRIPGLTLAVGLLLLGGASLASGQIEAPSEYLETIETPADVGGMADEVDAAEAQVEAGDGSGLSGPARGQIEEIVVSARRRDEFLEDTPVSVTALDESVLRDANVTRTDEIQNLVPNMTITGIAFRPSRTLVACVALGSLQADLSRINNDLRLPADVAQLDGGAFAIAVGAFVQLCA